MLEYNQIELRALEIKNRIQKTCILCGRSPDEVHILPVTKTHSVQAVQYAEGLGFKSVGENRVQEALEKMEHPEAPAVQWELIGHLQSNKAKLIPGRFLRVQSLDSIKLAGRLDRYAGEAGVRQACLVQVNTGEDSNKFGFREEEVDHALGNMLTLTHLEIEGFMTIGPLEGGREAARVAFARLRELVGRMRVRYGKDFPVLSMGMSGDLEEAVQEGSTQIRIGSALFGERK